MEESNKDEIIGTDVLPNEKDDPQPEPLELETKEEVSVKPPDRPPPKIVEVYDCNASNALMYQYFGQRDYVECKSLIGEIQSKYNEKNEAALHVRGLIARNEGELEEAMECFQKAYEVSGKNKRYYYEMGRCNFLLGRHQIAVEQLKKASEVMKNNPKVWYWLARALYHFPTEMMNGKQFNPVESAKTVLMNPDIGRDSALICFLGRLCEELQDTKGAIAAYQSALKLESDNTDVMIRLGLLLLRMGDEQEGFEKLGNCLAYDPSNSQALLTIGSIMQSHFDHDVALNKYRVAADVCDYNGCLWNNIGIALLARNKAAASHSALKKASFINPLDYKISYNLGVLHDIMNLHCSALHYIKLCTELKPQNAKAVGAMAVILSHMGDNKNARLAYKRSIELQPFPSIVLNYAIFEYRMKDYPAVSKAVKLYKELEAAGSKCSLNNKQTANLLDAVLKQYDQQPAEH
ncbi:hypothetical protein CRE_25560 [Caenorhabditis remanei]|uniref:Uncharacterized protein n=2 Tax=Caenorhabditis remanei TaxID=31234 RepID=E3LSA6_CAERE|nr:hypothetical protein CRE_25560 [Caenorhabditis remanei]